jgi:hypothetical protein
MESPADPLSNSGKKKDGLNQKIREAGFNGTADTVRVVGVLTTQDKSKDGLAYLVDSVEDVYNHLW